MTNKKILLPVLYLFSYTLSLYVVIQYLIFKPSQSSVVSTKLKDASFPYEIWKLFFYPHIILGMVALLIGAYQLTQKSRRNPKLHKKLGKIYGISILLNVLAVPYVALYATGGTPSTIAFLVLDLFWFGTTVIGIRHIWRKNVARHREWMLRSFAITFVFVTFRIVLLVLQKSIDAPLSFIVPLTVYLSIALNLFVTEVYLRKRSRNISRPIKGTV